MSVKRVNKKQVYILSALFVLIVCTFLVTATRISNPQQHSAAGEPTLADRLKMILKCRDRALNFERLQYGSYWLLQNLVVGTLSENVTCAETITYTTNADYTFINNLPMVVKSWLAPVSFALFAPGYDFQMTMESIQYVRNCLPEKDLIQKFVSFHIYFPNAHMPERVPLSRNESLSWTYNCSRPTPYGNIDRSRMYKSVQNLTYPINVGRNIARKAVNTYFIFACDIELVPSPNLAQLFLEMVDRNIILIQGNGGLRVFALPLFEIKSDATIPKTKNDLRSMFTNGTAIPFHQGVCRICHNVPEQDRWLSTTETEYLRVTAYAHREGKFVYWEPFYISDNNEPMFDERVTWEGESDKRIQNFAMCLLGYEYHVLHPSFLVHSPGIKIFNKHAPGMEYVKATNTLIHKVIESEYKILYGQNSKCKT